MPVVAAVVFVHGIGQQQRGPATLAGPWQAALADGVWKAGHGSLAARLRQPPGTAGAIAVEMAFYADLFDPPDRQGRSTDLGDLDPSEVAAIEELAGVLLRRAACVAGTEADRRTAQDEVARLEGRLGELQGVGNVARGALAAVARLRWFGPFGMAVAQRFVIRALVQVVRYLHEPALRQQVQARVAGVVGADTRVLIGHSLGSVVAFEAACRMGGRLPLLVTLGSPLGIRRLVYDRLEPQPPRFPERVDRWVNVAADDDIVAAVPGLTGLFPAGAPPAGTPANRAVDNRTVDNRTVDNGSAPHDVIHYLTKKAVGAPVADALAADDSRRSGSER
ncbi:lipase family protein [Frankia sp. Cas4]|uniref:lipase family protein n=1 Tax=Frankia sp. Cas4 TaxID=3073927 RepID=UPI002AD1F0D0|nr:lipase family protein [Frankia sp. Cas4]